MTEVLNSSCLQKTLSEIAALLGDNDEETASVYLSKNHVVFELNGYLVYSRLIEGEFQPL